MRYGYLFALVLMIDQLTKYLAMTSLKMYSSIPIIQNIIYLTYVRNAGAAFGIFPGMTYLFMISALILIIGVVIYFKKSNPGPSMALPLVLASAGASGNLLDRLIHHAVIDFIDIRIWPVFNVADMAIVAGSILLFFYLVYPDWMGECEFWKN